MTTPNPYQPPATDSNGYGNTPTYMPPSYPGPAYANPGYAQPPGWGQPIAPRNGIGTAALVCGILAIILDVTVYGGLILGILAIIFGGVGLGRTKRGEATNRGAAMAGLVMGIIALALLLVLIIVGAGLWAVRSST